VGSPMTSKKCPVADDGRSTGDFPRKSVVLANDKKGNAGPLGRFIPTELIGGVSADCCGWDTIGDNAKQWKRN
jgi:hypothetical protein